MIDLYRVGSMFVASVEFHRTQYQIHGSEKFRAAKFRIGQGSIGHESSEIRPLFVRRLKEFNSAPLFTGVVVVRTVEWFVSSGEQTESVP